MDAYTLYSIDEESIIIVGQLHNYCPFVFSIGIVTDQAWNL